MSGLAEVTSPPYDVIAQDIGPVAARADPHNVVRLILPPAGARPARATEYADAARLLRDWLAEGILVADDRARAVRLRAGGGRGPSRRPATACCSAG